MSKDWYEDVHKVSMQNRDLRGSVEAAGECIERLAEFAEHMAYERDEYKKGMTANFNVAMGFLSDLEEEQGKGESDVAMWRQLCHSRAVQLNEAYNTISELRDEVKSLLETIDDLIVR